MNSRIRIKTISVLCCLLLLVVFVLAAATPPPEASATTDNNNETKKICRVTIVDIESQGRRTQGNNDTTNLVCDVVIAMANGDNRDNDVIAVSDFYLQISSIPNKVVEANKRLLFNQTWFLEYSENQVATGKHGVGYLSFGDSEDIVTLPLSEVEERIVIASANHFRKNNKNQRWLRRRRRRRRGPTSASGSSSSSTSSSSSSTSSDPGENPSDERISNERISDESLLDESSVEDNTLLEQRGDSSFNESSLEDNNTSEQQRKDQVPRSFSVPQQSVFGAFSQPRPPMLSSSSSAIHGEKTLMVVLVGDVDTSEEDAYEHVFGGTKSLSSQVAGCSQSQTTLVPHPIKPVIRIQTNDRNASNYTFHEVLQESIPKIQPAVLGIWTSRMRLRGGGTTPSNNNNNNYYYNYNNLRSLSDYFLFVVPDAVGEASGGLAWAPLNGYVSMITDSWSNSVHVMMHEIGHNFGNSHAFKHGHEYEDVTTVMGFASRSSNLCFNGQNVWRMGWFLDRRMEIGIDRLLRDYYYGPEPTRVVVPLAFYGDYDKAAPDQPVVVKVGKDIFLTYNRKKGINNETHEYADSLLIVQERTESGEDGDNRNYHHDHHTNHPYSDLLGAIPRHHGAPFAFTMVGPYWVAIENDNKNKNNTNSSIKHGNSSKLIVLEVCSYNNKDNDGDNANNADVLMVAISNHYGGCDEYKE